MSSFWLILKQQWTIKISSPLFSIFSLAAILVGSRDHQTQFWKGAIQRPFHQSLVQIGPVALEELIKMWKVNGRTDGRRTTDDGRSVVTIAHMTLWVRWAKKKWSKGRTAGHIFGREPSNDYFIKILFLLSKWFQTRRWVLC